MGHFTRKHYKSGRSRAVNGRRRFHTTSHRVIKDFEKIEENRRIRELRVIRRRMGTIEFRTPKAINKMLKYTPYRLLNMPVKFFIISCHGSISRKKVFRMPPHMAAFDMAENEFRGCELVNPHDDLSIFDTIIGVDGSNLGMFFNAMLGGESPPDPLGAIPQIGYRAPGDLMYDFYLSLSNSAGLKDFNKTHGCWDITDAISTFNPFDFTYYDRSEDRYIEPSVRRTKTILSYEKRNLVAPPYKPEDEIVTMLRRDTVNTHMSDVVHTLEEKYPNTVCFIILHCCAGIIDSELPTNIIPEQPPAISHWAFGNAVGVPDTPSILYEYRGIGNIPYPYLGKRNR